MKTGEGRNGEMSQAAGRWPANLIHDGSEEVVTLFPMTESGSRRAGKHRVAGGQGRYGEFAVGELPEIVGDSGSAARFFYCAKASKADRGDDNNHPTVKPTDLMRYLCRLVTPPGGTVLDPFAGSGSTGKAAALEGFRFIGIEREAEYVEIARARIAAAVARAGLFERTAS
jgi:site-specific DNA-methyltransferase (adenine-specific)